MKDAILGSYSDLKVVKTRSVVQVIIEIPLERGAEVTGLLGLPQPNAEIPVAIFRMNPERLQPQPVAELEPPRRAAKLSQIAGIICNEGAFQRFIQVANADEAAEYVRVHCNVSSRANLDGNEDAAAAFKALKGEYDLWMRGEAA